MYQLSFQIVQAFFAKLHLYSLCSKRKSLKCILYMNFPNLAMFTVQPWQRRKIFLKYYTIILTGFFSPSSDSNSICVLWYKQKYLIKAKPQGS